MEKDSDKSNEIVIQKILKHFNELDQTEFKEDLLKAPKSNIKQKYLKKFVNKYSKKELNEQTNKEILHEIISKLVDLRQDFLTCIKIYLTIEDEEKADALRCHYILKKEKMSEVNDGEIKCNTYIKFGVSLSCIFEIETYYKKFIKGILRYFQAAFKENYLYEYIKCEDLKNLNEYKFYEKNIASFDNSLNKMLIDMERVILEHTNELKNINSEKKMKNSTFEIFQIRANLTEHDEITDIYKKCKNNYEILTEVRKLKEKIDEKKEKELFVNLKLFEYDIKEYIKKENFQIRIIKLQEETKESNAILKSHDTTLKNIETTLKNIEITLKNHEIALKNIEITLKSNEDSISKMQNEINELKGKVNYLEPLVVSLISGKE